MSLYFVISTSKILNQENYDKYVNLARPIIEKHGGEYVLQSDKVIASKDWDTEKIIIIKFDSKKQMDHCFQSPEYQKIIHLREGSIKSRFVMVES